MAAPKDCRKCPIDKLCDKYHDCVWPVYAAGIKEARPKARNSSSHKMPSYALFNGYLLRYKNFPRNSHEIYAWFARHFGH